MDGRGSCDEFYRIDAGRIPDTPAVASDGADHSGAVERKSAHNNSKNGKDKRPRGRLRWPCKLPGLASLRLVDVRLRMRPERGPTQKACHERQDIRRGPQRTGHPLSLFVGGGQIEKHI